MRKVIKTQGKMISAWKLGDNTNMEKTLLQVGKLKRIGEGQYEVFSREAIGGIGEKASVGDYIKIDSKGFPYPNTKEFFLSNHRHVEGEIYEQIASPIEAWFSEDELCEEIQFLIDNKNLKINKDDDSASYFSAPLWGTILSADKNAAIIFYSIERDDEGKIKDVDFNFVAREEFNKNYRFV